MRARITALVILAGVFASTRLHAQQSERPGFMVGINLATGSFAGNKLPGVYDKDYTYPTEENIKYYRSKGITLIRFPFIWERLQPELNGPFVQEELDRLDKFMAAARKYPEVKVILEPHNYARYRGKIIGTPEVPNSAFADFWTKLAAHYKDEKAVWAYGLVNEPHDTNGLWPAAAQAGVDAIRKSDPAKWIVVPGDSWSGAHSWAHANKDLWVNDPSKKVIYEAHQYFDNDYSGTYNESYEKEGATPTIAAQKLKPFIDWCKAKNVPGMIGEFGVPDDDPRWLAVLDNALATMKDANISAVYWAGGPWWGDYKLAVEPKDGKDQPQMSILEKYAK